MCFTHISNGQGSCESQVQTQYVVFWGADILSGCCQQQLMKISRVTVGKARTRSISPFSMLSNNAYFCSINNGFKYFFSCYGWLIFECFGLLCVSYNSCGHNSWPFLWPHQGEGAATCLRIKISALLCNSDFLDGKLLFFHFISSLAVWSKGISKAKIPWGLSMEHLYAYQAGGTQNYQIPQFWDIYL